MNQTTVKIGFVMNTHCKCPNCMLSKGVIFYFIEPKVEVQLWENIFARNPPTHIISVQVPGISYIYCHRETNDITVSSYPAKHSEIGFPPSLRFSICTPIKGMMSSTKRFHVEVKHIKSVKGNRVLEGILR